MSKKTDRDTVTTRLVIPEGTEEVDPQWLKRFTALRSVSFPDSVKKAPETLGDLTGLEEIRCAFDLRDAGDGFECKYMLTRFENIPERLRRTAAVTFAEEEDRFIAAGGEIAASYRDYICRARRTLYPVAFRHTALLALMTRYRMIHTGEIADLVSRCTQDNRPDSAAMLLAYRQALEETDGEIEYFNDLVLDDGPEETGENGDFYQAAERTSGAAVRKKKRPAVFNPELYEEVSWYMMKKVWHTVREPEDVDAEMGCCTFSSTSKNRRYVTTLEKCTCPAYKEGMTIPCKHMIMLALYLGKVSIDWKDKKE